MRAKTLPGLIFVAALLAAIIPNSHPAADSAKFDIMNLVGNWEGEGMFRMPVTNAEMSIEGEGSFVYDKANDRIRTSMQGSKFLISYSDSGYLQYYPETDSVSWEVWDSWGKHALYWGQIKEDRLVADRIHKNKNYRVQVTFPHPDTLDFHLIVRGDDNKEFDKARFLLWRVTEDR